MMTNTLLTGISILAQFVASYLALRLIPLSGKRTAWILISLGLFVAAIQRLLVFSSAYFGTNFTPSSLFTGIMALTISILFLVGIILIQTIFDELKDAREKAQLQSDYYQTLFTKSSSIMLLIDPQTAQIIDANEAACEYYGYSFQEITQKKTSDINTLDDKAISKEINRATRQERNFFLFQHQLANGEIRDVEVYSHPVKVNGQTLLYSIIHDVSEQQKTAHALKKTMNQNKLILDAVNEGIYGLDIVGDITFINTAALRMTGWETKDLLHTNHHARIHHSHADGTPYHPKDCPIHDTLKTGAVHFVNTDIFWRKDGTAFPVSFASTPIKDAEGNLKGAVVTFQDITELQAVELNTQRLMTAIEQSDESIIITDEMGTIEYANPAFERNSGYAVDEALGQNPRFLKSNQQDDPYYKNLWETITAGQVWRGEFINRKKDGTNYVEDASISPVFNADGEITNFVAVKRNITHQRAIEAQYRQSQKMEAIGRLTGGVAHDFNNILQGINGFSELLLVRMPLDAPYRAYAETILKSGQRAAALIRQLMLFSRNDKTDPKVVYLDDVVDGMSKMLSRLITEDIKLQNEAESGLWPIKIDPVHAEQVVMNLVVNARDAMPNGGTITIKTSNVVFTKEFTARHLFTKPGKHVRLEVIDTGLGMSEETKTHVFEPFFTTKAQGKGTGLGLSTVYGIVKQNDADIDFESEIDKGTHCNIYFPVATDSLSKSELTNENPSLPKTKKEHTILVIEDEIQVQNIVANILNEVGYTVITANSGEEAIQLAKQLRCNFDLLLTDIILPGIDGKNLVSHLQKQCPHIKVIYMTGYTQDIITDKNIATLEGPLIEKPFSATQLVDIVEASLN